MVITEAAASMIRYFYVGFLKGSLPTVDVAALLYAAKSSWL